MSVGYKRLQRTALYCKRNYHLHGPSIIAPVLNDYRYEAFNVESNICLSRKEHFFIIPIKQYMITNN